MKEKHHNFKLYVQIIFLQYSIIYMCVCVCVCVCVFVYIYYFIYLFTFI